MKKITSLKSLKGQVLIETLVTLPFISILVGSLFLFLYLYWSKLILEHITFENLVCENTYAFKGNCKSISLQRLNSLLPIKKRVEINSSNKLVYGKVLLPFHLEVISKQEL